MSGLRPSTPGDAQAVLGLLAARDAVDYGVADFTREALLDEWRASDFHPAVDAVVAEERGVPIGYAALFEPGGLAFVDPAHEGRGAGSRLLAWLERRARELRRDCHRQRVAQTNATAHDLLDRAGYYAVRSLCLMVRDLAELPAVPPPPEGIVLHSVDVERDARALHAADAAAFAGNADYQPESLERFQEQHLASPEVDAVSSLVARRGEAVAGFVLCRRPGRRTGYVDLLAVDPAERGQGLGGALLLAAFAGFAAGGLLEAQLDVASDNPRGLALYERAGMTVRHRTDVFEKPVAI